MSAPRNRGLVLVLVIVALSLTAVVMAVLTAGANTMLFHADRAHCQALQRNLCTSALAWARHRAADPNATFPQDPIKLDTSALSPRPAILAVSFPQSGDNTRHVRVETSCTKGRQALQTVRSYEIPPAQ
jgi:hypothetical protein